LQYFEYFTSKSIAINTKCNPKDTTSIAIPLALLESIAILTAIIAIGYCNINNPVRSFDIGLDS